MVMLLKSVKGLRVLVTGGCSGLGAATARRLLDHGARVLIVDSVADPASARCPPPKQAAFCRADITSEDEMAAAMATAEKQFGGLDAAVNCAGASFAARIYNWNTDTSFGLADFTKLLTINAVGTFNVCRLAARLMAKNPGASSAPTSGGKKVGAAVAAKSLMPDGARGVIVNTASSAAFEGQIGQVIYVAGKAAVAAMTLPMARDLAAIGIRVCTISPGYFDTPQCRRDNFPPRVVKFLADHNRAIHRLGRPEEFADAVESVLLNPMLNGVNIRLDAASRGFFFNRKRTALPVGSASGAAEVEEN